MLFTPTAIPEVILISPDIFRDPRGYFFESYNRAQFTANGIDHEFLQDNQSLSSKNVLRGLHYQNPPYGQGKLVRVITGAVLDVAVDIRKSSPTFGKWVSALLTEENMHMLWLPPGFAHGFVTLAENTIFSYKCTNVYNRESEGIIRWNDPELAIDWGIASPQLSERDQQAPLFRQAMILF